VNPEGESPFGMERCLLTIHVQVTLGARRQDDGSALEAEGREKVEELLTARGGRPIHGDVSTEYLGRGY
jgi:hypothetical protein